MYVEEYTVYVLLKCDTSHMSLGYRTFQSIRSILMRTT